MLNRLSDKANVNDATITNKLEGMLKLSTYIKFIENKTNTKFHAYTN